MPGMGGIRMVKKLRLVWDDKSQRTENERRQTHDFESVEDALQFLLTAVDTLYDEAPLITVLKHGDDGVWRLPK